MSIHGHISTVNEAMTSRTDENQVFYAQVIHSGRHGKIIIKTVHEYQAKMKNHKKDGEKLSD